MRYKVYYYYQMQALLNKSSFFQWSHKQQLANFYHPTFGHELCSYQYLNPDKQRAAHYCYRN